MQLKFRRQASRDNIFRLSQERRACYPLVICCCFLRLYQDPASTAENNNQQQLHRATSKHVRACWLVASSMQVKGQHRGFPHISHKNDEKLHVFPSSIAKVPLSSLTKTRKLRRLPQHKVFPRDPSRQIDLLQLGPCCAPPIRRQAGLGGSQEASRFA